VPSCDPSSSRLDTSARCCPTPLDTSAARHSAICSKRGMKNLPWSSPTALRNCWGCIWLIPLCTPVESSIGPLRHLTNPFLSAGLVFYISECWFKFLLVFYHPLYIVCFQLVTHNLKTEDISALRSMLLVWEWSQVSPHTRRASGTEEAACCLNSISTSCLHTSQLISRSAAQS